MQSEKTSSGKKQNEIGVYIRAIQDDGTLGELKLKFYPITTIVYLRIGSIWRGGRHVGDMVLAAKRFVDVNLDRDGWTYVSKKHPKGGPSPIPQETHELLYPEDQTHLIRFDLKGGGFLFLPCLELLSRGYGRSQEVVRIITTYDWPGSAKRLGQSRSPKVVGEWSVELGQKVSIEDGEFVAATLNNQYASHAVEKIYLDLECGFNRSNADLAFLRIQLWFHGSATLSVSGLELPGGRDFLALRLNGYSLPTYLPRIEITTAKTEEDDDDESGSANAPRLLRLSHEDLKDIPLTGAQAPDRDAAYVELDADPFEIIGPRKPFRRTRYSRAGGLSGPPIESETKPKALSADDAFGSGKGVATADIEAPTERETHGWLLDMWNAMVKLQSEYPDLIKSVEYYADGAFHLAERPRLVPLILPRKPADRSHIDEVNAARAWARLLPSALGLRGLLVAKLKVRDLTRLHGVISYGRERSIVILEIQRRRDTLGDKEKSSGLVWESDSDAELAPRVERLSRRIPMYKSVRVDAENLPPGAKAFAHKQAAGTDVAANVVKLALKRKDVDVDGWGAPRPDKP